MRSCVGDGQDGGNSTACCHRVLSFDSACILISVRCLLCGIERIGVGMGYIPISAPQRALRLPFRYRLFSFLPHSLFLTQSHSSLHHRVNPNSITNTLYHSHTFTGPHYSENGEVISNAILNRGKSIDRFSLLFFSFFLHTHTLFRSLLLPFSISFHPLSHSILIFAKAMISQCNPSSAHSIYSMLCVRVHSIQYHSPLLHSNSPPLPTLSLSLWNGCGIWNDLMMKREKSVRMKKSILGWGKETLVFTRLFRVVSNVADFEVVEWCVCEKRLCVF